MRSAVLALVGALALVACGRSGGGDGGGAVVTSVPRDDGYQKPRNCDGGVTLSLIGANPGPVSSLVLHLLDGVHLREVGGGAPPTFEGPPFLMLDVSTDAHHYDLGVIHLPSPDLYSGSEPQFEVRLSFAHAVASVGALSGDATDCGGDFSFRFSPTRLNVDRCEIRVVLDVGRSVTSCATGLSFLPHFRVFY